MDSRASGNDGVRIEGVEYGFRFRENDDLLFFWREGDT